MHKTEYEEARLPRGEATVTPPASTIAAAVSLLADSDPRVEATCREHILTWGTRAVPLLRVAIEDMDPRMRRRARALLRTLELRSWVMAVERLSRAMPVADSRTRDPQMLETGALLLSSLGRDAAAGRGAVVDELERHGAEFRKLVRSRPRTAASSARTLREYLGRKHGYTSQLASQFDLADTVLDAVVASRRGLPIALVVLYLLVGRRAGLSMAAVQVPDAILIRVHGARSTLLDPAENGRAMSNAECIRELRARGHTGPASSMLVELDDREVMLCLLDNLARIYGFREDAEVLRAIHRAAGALLSGC